MDQKWITFFPITLYHWSSGNLMDSAQLMELEHQPEVYKVKINKRSLDKTKPNSTAHPMGHSCIILHAREGYRKNIFAPEKLNSYHASLDMYVFANEETLLVCLSCFIYYYQLICLRPEPGNH